MPSAGNSGSRLSTARERRQGLLVERVSAPGGSIATDGDVEPAERRWCAARSPGRSSTVVVADSITAGPVDRLAGRQRLEVVDRHLAPLAEIDPALAAGGAGGARRQRGSCGSAGSSPITATRALTSTASWSRRL